VDLLPLFDDPQEERFDRKRFAERLRELAQDGVLIGGSSWKYEGWLGQIYTRERYLWRGKLSQKRFEEDCLAEYAETFPIVGGDFSFYQFPTPEFWAKLFRAVPKTFQFGLKAPEEITIREFPMHARYGSKAGLANPLFLSREMFEGSFLEPLEPYREQIAVIMFEFGTFARNVYDSVDDYLRDLEPFLASLPAGWRFAVEIRNPSFLVRSYFDLLARYGVAHVFNAWTRMPTLAEQLAIEGAFTTDFIVARALLRKGRSYEDAVKLFAPYTQVQDPNPETRRALRHIVERARQRKERAYLFINNRLEGNAPGTIEGILDETHAADVQ
jgi:uncharacterized protein YecE (DUF72 family)